MHARGLEHHSHGVQNVLSAINIVLASGPDRPRRTAATRRSPARATAKAGASTGRNATNSPAAAIWPTRSTAPTSAGVWGIDPDELPQPGVDAYEIFRKIDRGEIKGLLCICFNPVVSLPGQ